VPRGRVVSDAAAIIPSEQQLKVPEETRPNGNHQRKLSLPETSDNPPYSSFLVRRRSSGNRSTMEPVRSDDPDFYSHLRHLGPSNAANRPKSTRINTVKIKPGQVPDIPQTIPEYARPASSPAPGLDSPSTVLAQDSHAPEGGVGEGLLASAGREASDGVHSLAVGYGTMAAPASDRMSWKSGRSGPQEDEPRSPFYEANENGEIIVDNQYEEPSRPQSQSRNGSIPEEQRPGTQRSKSASTIGSLHSAHSPSNSPLKKRHTARSGSISQNVVDVNGIKKIVLETTSSSDSEDKTLLVAQADGAQDSKDHSDDESNAGSKAGGNKKKQRKKRGKKKKGTGGDGEDSQPLLGDGR
jgi:metal transporter CNNM